MSFANIFDSSVAAGLGGVEQTLSPPAHLVQTIVLIADVHRDTSRLVEVAEASGAPWRAVHVALDGTPTSALRDRWEADVGVGELVILKSPDGSLVSPIRRYIQRFLFRYPTGLVHVVIGQVHTGNLFTQLLHQTPYFISRYALCDLERVITTFVPIHLMPNDGWQIRPTSTTPRASITRWTVVSLAFICLVLILIYVGGWAVP